MKKLGFAPVDTLFVKRVPDWYEAFSDENGLQLTRSLPATHAHIFCYTKADLINLLNENELELIEKSLWLSWPKQSSGVKTDLNEQTFRDLVLRLGWVDVKVAAIDETWSGLKFLRRKNNSN